MNTSCATPAALATSAARTTTTSSTNTHVSTLQPSSTLLAFVRRQIAQTQPFDGDERRSELRHLLAMPVVVQAVDERFHPCAAPQAMVIRDYSSHGLAMVNEHPFEHPRVLVHLTFPDEGKVLAAEVRWCRALGPFYHVGCEVIGKLDGVPPPTA